MTQTIAQYLASVRIAAESAGMEIKNQRYLWPYPQAQDSHLLFWLKEWEKDDSLVPQKHVKIMLIHSGDPGILIRIKPGELKPSEVIRRLSAL